MMRTQQPEKPYKKYGRNLKQWKWSVNNYWNNQIEKINPNHKN